MCSSSSPAAAACFGRENPLFSLPLQHSWGCVQGTDAGVVQNVTLKGKLGSRKGSFGEELPGGPVNSQGS